jgi:23S rRNA pseudouridine1911/1915/1917 synthase
MTEQHTLTISEELAGERLDKALNNAIPELSRSRIQQLIAEGQVLLNGATVAEGKMKIKQGDELSLNIPATEPSQILVEPIPLDIVFEDEHLLVINKPAGLTVHPAAGQPRGTLVNALLHHCGDTLSGIGGVERPGIVHRLDKDTSGLLVVAKHDKAHRHLSRQLEKRTLKRYYEAFVWGRLKYTEGMIEAPVGRSPRDRKKMAVTSKGKEAITHFTVKEEYTLPGHPAACILSRVECELETGRTHQIRVHMNHIGHSLIGDPVYGGKTAAARLRSYTVKVPGKVQEALYLFSRQALHAKKLIFIHPVTGHNMEFMSALPEDINILQQDISQLEARPIMVDNS